MKIVPVNLYVFYFKTMATLYDEITLGYTACGGHKAGTALGRR